MKFFKLKGYVRNNGKIAESRWYPMDIEWDDINCCIVYSDVTLVKYIKLMNDICTDVKVIYTEGNRYDIEMINRRDGYK